MRSASWTARLAASLWLVVAAGAAARAQEMQVAVPRAVIYPGVVLTDELLVDKAFAPGPAIGLLTDRAELVGKVTRVTLLPGQPIAVSAVREEALIKQGKQVRAVFQLNGLIITGTAVALQPGMVGDEISLRNTESGTTIKGTVQADGTIRVGPP